MNKLRQERKEQVANFASLSLDEKIEIFKSFLSGKNEYEEHDFSISIDDEIFDGLFSAENILDIRINKDYYSSYFLKVKGFDSEISVAMVDKGGSVRRLLVNKTDGWRWNILSFHYIEKYLYLVGDLKVRLTYNKLRSDIRGKFKDSDGNWKEDGTYKFEKEIYEFNHGIVEIKKI